MPVMISRKARPFLEKTLTDTFAVSQAQPLGQTEAAGVVFIQNANVSMQFQGGSIRMHVMVSPIPSQIAPGRFTYVIGVQILVAPDLDNVVLLDIINTTPDTALVVNDDKQINTDIPNHEALLSHAERVVTTVLDKFFDLLLEHDMTEPKGTQIAPTVAKPAESALVKPAIEGFIVTK